MRKIFMFVATLAILVSSAYAEVAGIWKDDKQEFNVWIQTYTTGSAAAVIKVPDITELMFFLEPDVAKEKAICAQEYLGKNASLKLIFKSDDEANAVLTLGNTAKKEYAIRKIFEASHWGVNILPEGCGDWGAEVTPDSGVSVNIYCDNFGDNAGVIFLDILKFPAKIEHWNLQVKTVIPEAKIKPNTKYSLSFWAKQDVPLFFSVSLEQVNTGASAGNLWWEIQGVGDGEWHHHSRSFTTIGVTDNKKLTIHFGYPGNSIGQFQLKKVELMEELTEGSEAMPWSIHGE